MKRKTLYLTGMIGAVLLVGVIIFADGSVLENWRMYRVASMLQAANVVRWDKPEEKMESPVAKATYSKAQQVWKVYWKRADLKWLRYDPTPEVDQLVDFLCVG